MILSFELDSRKLVLSAKNHPESVADLGFTFEVDEITRDGTVQSVELIPNGQNITGTEITRNWYS